MSDNFKKKIEESQDIEYLKDFCLHQIELNEKLHRRAQHMESRENQLNLFLNELQSNYSDLENRYINYKANVVADIARLPLWLKIFVKGKIRT